MAKYIVCFLILLPAVAVGAYVFYNFYNAPPAFNNNYPFIMKIESIAFGNNGTIPAAYTCDGENTNPPLAFSGVPSDAKSLVLVMEDHDAPLGTWVHWLVWNIAPRVITVGEGEAPSGAVQGTTSFGTTQYGGPCPPSGEHRYLFILYALDTELDLSEETKKEGLEEAMLGHVLDKAELVGLYRRI